MLFSSVLDCFKRRKTFQDMLFSSVNRFLIIKHCFSIIFIKLQEKK